MCAHPWYPWHCLVRRGRKGQGAMDLAQEPPEVPQGERCRVLPPREEQPQPQDVLGAPSWKQPGHQADPEAATGPPSGQRRQGMVPWAALGKIIPAGGGR